MTPERAIAKLDRKLQQVGSDVVLSRGSDELTVRAFPKGYKGDELGDGIEQGDSLVIISPTGLAGSMFAVRLPERGDFATFGGRRRYIENADPVLLNNVVVRINLQVRG